VRLLTRYVLVQLLLTLFVSLFALTGLIVLAGVAREAITMGLGLIPTLRLIPYILPDALRYAVPGTVLLATTSVYGRMAGSNEIVAVKSLGISPMVLIWPLVVLSAFVSLATVWLNDVAVSWGRDGVNRVVLDSAEEIAYRVLKNQRYLSTPWLTISVEDVVDRRLIAPTIRVNYSDEYPPGAIMADEAEIRSDQKNGVLSMPLRNVTGDFGQGYGLRNYDEFTFQVPIHYLLKRGGRGGGPADKSLRDIPSEISRRTEALRDERETQATLAAFQMMSGDFDPLTDKVWQLNHQRRHDGQEMLYKLATEPHRRWANGFSCLFFALVGAPMAIRRRHGDYLASFFAVFLPILLVYYPLLVGGVIQAKNGVWPPECVWLGNLVFAIWAIWLMRRVIRY